MLKVCVAGSNWSFCSETMYWSCTVKITSVIEKRWNPRVLLCRFLFLSCSHEVWAFQKNTDSSFSNSSWGWGRESWDMGLLDDVWEERRSRGTGGSLVRGLCVSVLDVECILSVHILAVKNKKLLDTGVLGCSLDGFGCSRVGVCGLEVLGRISEENSKRTTET